MTFLLLALVRPGQLGGGDIKVAGIAGLGLGWLGWSTLINGAALALVLSAIVSLGAARRAAHHAAQRDLFRALPPRALIAMLANGHQPSHSRWLGHTPSAMRRPRSLLRGSADLEHRCKRRSDYRLQFGNDRCIPVIRAYASVDCLTGGVPPRGLLGIDPALSELEKPTSGSQRLSLDIGEGNC